jgi:hypothetical protein
LRRTVIRQHYRIDVLQDALNKLRVETEKLSSPVRIIESLEESELELKPSPQPESPPPSPAAPEPPPTPPER